MVKHIKKVALLLCISFLSFHSVPAQAQEQEAGGFDSHKLLYGLHLGFTENRVDLYYTQGGEAYAWEDGNYSFNVPGFRIATIWDFRLGNHFRLRTMPGVMFFGRNLESIDAVVPISPSIDYKVESVLGELPVDVKFYPFRSGKIKPYLCSGLSYGFDFTSLRKDSDAESVQRLNAHDLRYTFGVGFDRDTRYLRLGMELNASFGLLSPSTGGNYDNAFYFHGGPSFSIGINIEA